MAALQVRSLLRKHGREQNTWVSLNSDNGPEVSPASGQGTGGAASLQQQHPASHPHHDHSSPEVLECIVRHDRG